MPVSVQVPIKVRVDRATVVERPDEVVEAFVAAVGRALQASKDVVLDARGGYLVVRPHLPTFAWGGDDLDAMPLAAQRNLEHRLTATVDELVHSTGLFGGDEAAAEAPAPLAEPPVERLDDERLDHIFRAYLVPSYQGRVEFLDFEGDVVTRRAKPTVRTWARLRTGQQVTGEMLRRAVEQWRAQVTPGSSLGFIVRERVMGRWQWSVVVLGKPPSTFSFEDFGEMEFVGERADPPFRPRKFEPPPGLATAEWRSVAGRAAVSGLLAADWTGAEIRGDLRRVRPKGDTVTHDEYETMLDKAVARELERRADEVLGSLPAGKEPTSAVRVLMSGASVTLLGTADDEAHLLWAGTAQLVPLTVERPGRASEGKRKSEGRQKAKGAGAEPAGRRGEEGEEGEAEGAEERVGPEGVLPSVGEGRLRAAFVFMPSAGAPPKADGALFPVVHGGLLAQSFECEPFEGEPTIDDLGPQGADLKRLMEDIAFRLQMPVSCTYPASFCIQAANMLASRGADISRYIGATELPAFTRPARDLGANLGPIDFRPVASPAIQYLRHLAGVVPRLRTLMTRVIAVYDSPVHQPKITGTWAGKPISWRLRFWEAMTPTVRTATMWLFLPTCQAMLLQLLLASKDGIDHRIERFTAYAPIFERLMASQLTDYAELSRFRDQLRHHQWAATVHQATAAGGDVTAVVTAVNPATAWFTAARGVSGLFLGVEAATQTPGQAGQIVTEKGVARIRDSVGLLWSLDDLEQAMVMQRGLAEGIDPLVKQIGDVPDLIERFRTNRNVIRDELWRVLHEMRVNNAEMLVKARRDVMFAFGASRIQEHIPSATVPGSRYALQGIHLQAHDQIGQFFHGDPWYAGGIDHLFASEEGRAALTGAFMMVGIVGLSILCPPLGVAVGVGVAVGDVAKAREKERLYGSLIDPELVLTRVEVEIELFAAYLGLALSILPEAGTAVGAVARGGKVAFRAGVGAGTRAAGRYVVRRVTREIIEAASKDLLERFVAEIVTNVVMDKLVEQVMSPILAAVEHDYQIRSAVGGPRGANVILAILADQQPRVAL